MSICSGMLGGPWLQFLSPTHLRSSHRASRVLHPRLHERGPAKWRVPAREQHQSLTPHHQSDRKQEKHSSWMNLRLSCVDTSVYTPLRNSDIAIERRVKTSPNSLHG